MVAAGRMCVMPRPLPECYFAVVIVEPTGEIVAAFPPMGKGELGRMGRVG
jgi:hypothetical protein